MKISFVIPAYNEEKHIGKCLDSVFNEIKNDPKIKVILADNGSTDRTREIVASYPKAKLVVESKKGANSARQAGFLTAKGDLMAGVDADLAYRLNKVGRVKFTFGLPIYSSGRRLMAESIFTTGLRYTLNYFWMVLCKKPFSQKSLDIRTDGGAFPDQNKAREFAIAFSAVLIFLTVTAGVLFGVYKILQSSGAVNAVSFVSQKAEARKIDDKINELLNKPTKELKNNIKR